MLKSFCVAVMILMLPLLNACALFVDMLGAIELANGSGKTYQASEYEPNPVDNSPEKTSQLGIVNVKYNVAIMTLPGWAGERVEEIDHSVELKAVKETDHWVYVKTPTGHEGWIAKNWINDRQD